MERSSKGSELLTREEAAAYLGLRPQTLAVWFCRGQYDLPVLKVGRAVRYRRSDLDAWLESRVATQSISEVGDG